jgi:GNAT superfamily N-acetyltransferase
VLITGYRISSETDDMNISVIHGFISKSYWAKNIPLSTMETAINNSLCFGVFTDDGEQVAFARMITDSATFAYLADVFVLEEHRGKGISKWLMKNIMAHPKLQGIRRMTLATSDAHGLYKEFGFKALHSPGSFMELHQPDVYKKQNKLGGALLP